MSWCQLLMFLKRTVNSDEDDNVTLVCYRYTQVASQRVGHDKIFTGYSFPLAG
jgi:hypothetical protein